MPYGLTSAENGCFPLLPLGEGVGGEGCGQSPHWLLTTLA